MQRIRKKVYGMVFVVAGFAALFFAGHLSGVFLPPHERLVFDEVRLIEKLGGTQEDTWIETLEHSSEDVLEDSAAGAQTDSGEIGAEPNKDMIKWVDFNVPYAALNSALALDIEYYGTGTPISWIDLLAVLACEYGNEFSRYKKADLTKLSDRIQKGEAVEDIAAGYSYFNYYREAYTAILGGFVGEFDIQVPDKEDDALLRWERKYGLKVFSPIAGGYGYSHSDDFGNRRSYGYSRRHLGHDLLGAVGTPVVAIESGTVEALGWNQYGGWRIGIRSFDNKRYYYYAHLRKNHPYHYSLKEGDTVMAGDVIGYLGRTGYSRKENVNNIKTPHLHIGMQLIFDESQKESANEIWIDLYGITRLLSKNRAAVYKNDDTRDYYRQFAFSEDVPEGF